MSAAADPVKVLIVDDQAVSRRLAAIWLADGLRGRVDVLEADSLAEMRAVWARERPAIVLLDQRLPDGDGLDGARELLAQDPDAAVILLTGMVDPLLDEEAERAGVCDFLVKHEIDGPMLARTVRFALRRRQDRRELRRSEERYRNLVQAMLDHYRAAAAGEARDFAFSAPDGRTYRTAFRPLRAGGADAVEATAVTVDVTDQG